VLGGQEAGEPCAPRYRNGRETISVSASKQAGIQSAQRVAWCSPVVGSLKINTDGAFLQDLYTGATGAVMRDCSGLFRVESARWLDSMGSMLLAEAEDLREGVRLIPEGTRENVILETDSHELVSLWNNKGKILGDIEEMTKTLPSVRAVHT